MLKTLMRDVCSGSQADLLADPDECRLWADSVEEVGDRIELVAPDDL
jgi:hypothetical protein